MKLVHTDANSKMVQTKDGDLVGQALLLANGRWAPFDLNGTRLVVINISFLTAQDVLAFFKAAHNHKVNW